MSETTVCLAGVRPRSGGRLEGIPFCGMRNRWVIHAPTCRMPENNCRLVQKLLCRPVRGVCRKEVGVLRTDPLNEIFARTVTSGEMVVMTNR